MCVHEHEGLAKPEGSAATYHSLDCIELLYLCTPGRKTSLLFAEDKLKHQGCVLVTMTPTTCILLFKSMGHKSEHLFCRSTKALPRFPILMDRFGKIVIPQDGDFFFK